MKNNAKLTLCALMASLAAAVNLMAYFPYLTFALPALAGLCIMVVLIEINMKWAFLTYVSSAVIVFFIGEFESKLLYISFLGYYPILKALLERFKSPVLQWAVKGAAFNAVIIAVYTLFANALGVNEDVGTLGKYSIYVLLLIANAVFVIYDISISRMADFYLIKLHPKIKKVFRV